MTTTATNLVFQYSPFARGKARSLTCQGAPGDHNSRRSSLSTRPAQLSPPEGAVDSITASLSNDLIIHLEQ
ncbi:3469_t:CDS:2 [Racocetra fulgida]|uniref:3469_t:CDS:1 n=1 Tax=Racocetra fulgida TaxID=60492 RepID=A0A9N9FFE2_9GLOM|nr:3469_t:CDS:2 [Racocetra fulgida]